jgi:cytochrome b6-f complex iron-sulfur subunit
MAEDEQSPGTVEQGASLNRREVLIIGANAGTGLLAAAVPMARYLGPISAGEAGDSARIPADQLALWQAERILVRGAPGFVIRTPEQIYACSAICPHLGCVVKWNRSRRVFFCPCHGARFAPDGRVLGGPSPESLQRFDVATSRGKIVVERG